MEGGIAGCIPIQKGSLNIFSSLIEKFLLIFKTIFDTLVQIMFFKDDHDRWFLLLILPVRTVLLDFLYKLD